LLIGLVVVIIAGGVLGSLSLLSHFGVIGTHNNASALTPVRGGTWTFHVKPNLVWSDGQPFVARDVDFTWKLWANPKFAGNATSGLDLISSTEVSADHLAITFHLKSPFSPFLADVWVDGNLAPLPRHHFSKMRPEQILKSSAGSIDSNWFLDVKRLQEYEQLSNYTLVTPLTSSEFEALYFNFHNTVPANHLEVRQAMAMAIDQQPLIEMALHGFALPLCTDHPTAMHPGYEPYADCPNFDPAAANKLLDDSGWVKGPDGVRAKSGQRLEFEYSMVVTYPARLVVESIIQRDFQAIGIKLDIQNYPHDTFIDTILPGGKASPPTGAVAGRYDIAELDGGYSYDPDDSASF
jgi:peptide/nickel transport system substrate-binding protein